MKNQEIIPMPADADKARLPTVYVEARKALERCVKIDECQQWRKKAEALASYARQMHDNELKVMAERIQHRAIAKAGELLREIEKATGAHLKSTVDHTLSRKQAAKDAGMSKYQKDTAIQYSNIPGAKFEEMVESANPPTVKQFSDMGKKTKPKPLIDLGTRTPEEYREAGILYGILEDVTKESAKVNIDQAIRGLNETEFKECQIFIASAIGWLGNLQITMNNQREK